MGTILTQMRLGLSPLRGQLFQYNLTDNPFCPHCLTLFENPLHFFLECSGYQPFRGRLLNEMDFLLTEMNTVYGRNSTTVISKLTNTSRLHILLNGFDSAVLINSSDAADITKFNYLNKTLYNSIIKFIKNSKRFDT
jgi:hypothetical protein